MRQIRAWGHRGKYLAGSRPFADRQVKVYFDPVTGMAEVDDDIAGDLLRSYPQFVQEVFGGEGEVGLSAYELAVQEGFEGTLQEWLDSLVGPQGPQGIQGVQGIQGTQGPAGNDGAQGPPGADGDQGIQGVPGNDGPEGPEGPQGIQGVPGNDGADGADGAPGAASTMNVAYHTDASANVTLTNQASAEGFLGSSDRSVKLLDLTNFTQIRIVTRVTTGSASANTPRLRVRYKTGAFSGTVGNYSDIGTSEVATSLASTGVIASSWIDLAAGAKADVQVAVTQLGGDAAADPAVGAVTLQFK